MFEFFKEKAAERRLKERALSIEHLNQRIAENEQKVAKYEQFLEDFTNNYVLIRKKCIDIIRKHGLGRYPLKTVLDVVVLADNKIEFKVYDIKEDYWDEEKTLFRDKVLLDEIVQLNTLKLLPQACEAPGEWPSERDALLESLDSLKDVTNDFARLVKQYSFYVEEFKKRYGYTNYIMLT